MREKGQEAKEGRSFQREGATGRAASKRSSRRRTGKCPLSEDAGVHGDLGKGSLYAGVGAEARLLQVENTT